MKINNSVEFQDFCPYIKTEETIFELIKRDKDLISDDFELMPYPLAHWINTLGIDRTNGLIASLDSDKIRVFVCQHIFVDRLIFNESNDIIFTPHSSNNDRFITIPHYAVNVDRSLIKEDRKLHFSFMGSTTTHPTRKRLVQKYPDNCYDSKVHWGLDHGLPENFSKLYMMMLADSTFGVCPRGTGISSVRLFESMAMGSIPVIVADDYDPPLSKVVDWDRISIQLPEKQVLSDDKYLISMINNHLEFPYLNSMREEMMDIYDEYFSNENLHKTIMMTLETIL
ncbi:MAG: putative glycosyltransferase [uncultured marine phage]|uniref:Putative glycosyltransferase n=1 Tax=uncultured marine phage TaxID=707152 RepID=A0A8D9CCB6_9VIRU|nr:MAG: putative glycosyltransferase [uncultured marine phage]